MYVCALEAASAFAVLERKIIRKKFHLVRGGNNFCTLINYGLYERLSNMDIVQCINIQWLV